MGAYGTGTGGREMAMMNAWKELGEGVVEVQIDIGFRNSGGVSNCWHGMTIRHHSDRHVYCTDRLVRGCMEKCLCTSLRA